MITQLTLTSPQWAPRDNAVNPGQPWAQRLNWPWPPTGLRHALSGPHVSDDSVDPDRPWAAQRLVIASGPRQALTEWAARDD